MADQAQIEITPEMIDAGVHAFIGAYDHEAEGLDNLRLTVRAVLAAGLVNRVDHSGHSH